MIPGTEATLARQAGAARILRRALGAAAACAVFATPATALGATASVQNGAVVYTAGLGEANAVTFEPAFFNLGAASIQDSAPLMPGPGCESISETKVDCQLAGVTSASFSLGDGNDQFTLSTLSLAVTVSGGPGDDTLGPGAAAPVVMSGDAGDDTLNGGDGADQLSGGDGRDTIQGQLGDDRIDGGAGNDNILGDRPVAGLAAPGADTISGGAGNDRISGQGGNDAVDGGAGNDSIDEEYSGANSGGGADTVSGGAGRDQVLYHFRTSRLSVSLDGRANDGERGERDNVRPDVENVVGAGGAPNVLTGSSRANELRGGKSVDRISGGGGADRLFAFGGRDRLSGGSGNDRLYANDCQSDQLNGGPGRDNAVIDIGRLDRVLSIERRLRARCA